MNESVIRAADEDRAAVARELAKAHDAGRLTPAGFDERTLAAYRARTYAELGTLTADLPKPSPVPVKSVGDVVTRVVAGGWFAASAINLLVRGVVSLAATSPCTPGGSGSPGRVGWCCRRVTWPDLGVRADPRTMDGWRTRRAGSVMP